MKVRKQIDKLRAMLDGSARERRKHQDELRCLLKRMKSKEKHLTKKIDARSDTKERKYLENEINLLHEQRKKGLASLKSLSE